MNAIRSLLPKLGAALLTVLAAAVPAQEETSWTPAQLDRAAREIDGLVAKGLRATGDRATGRIDDPTFARRTFVHVAGRIPTLEELRGFLADRSATRRADLVDRLVA